MYKKGIMFDFQDLLRILNIEEKVLREYILLFESKGYKFSKDILGEIEFSEEDVESLMKFTLFDNLNNKKVNIETPDLIDYIHNKSELFNDRNDAIFKEEVIIRLNAMKENILEDLIKLNRIDFKNSFEKEKELMFKTIKEKFENDIERRDRKLVQSLRESIESKRIQLEKEKKEEETKKTKQNIINKISIFFQLHVPKITKIKK